MISLKKSLPLSLKKSLINWNNCIIIISFISTFHCPIAMYFCHSLFQLDQTVILTGCREDLCVSDDGLSNEMVKCWWSDSQNSWRWSSTKSPPFNLFIQHLPNSVTFLVIRNQSSFLVCFSCDCVRVDCSNCERAVGWWPFICVNLALPVADLWTAKRELALNSQQLSANLLCLPLRDRAKTSSQ